LAKFLLEESVSRGFSMKVVEVTYSWPAETFIERHVLALRDARLDVCPVARHGTTFEESGASIGEARRDIPAEVMPNFDHLDLVGKVWSLRHVLTRVGRAEEARPVRDRVLLAFFERLKPDPMHFHMASLAVLMRWIPQTLGVPYTVSLPGSDVQVIPLRSDRVAQETGRALKEAAGVHAVCDALVGLGARWAGRPLHCRTIYTTVPIAEGLPPYVPKYKELEWARWADCTGARVFPISYMPFRRSKPAA
jgi:hypothetical protein